MFAAFLPVFCGFLCMLGITLASKGTWFATVNPVAGGPAIPEQRGLLIVGWICLAIAALGFYIFLPPEWVKTVQTWPGFITWQVLVGAGIAILLSLWLTAYGDLNNNIVGEFVGACLLVGGVLVGLYCLPTEYHLTLRNSVFTSLPNVAVVVPAPASIPAAPAAAAPVAPAPAAVAPAPPVATPKPILTSDPARVEKVTWLASNPKEVKFEPIEADRQWAIVHEDLKVAFPNGVMVSKDTYTFGGKDLKNVQVYEIDRSDPANKVATSKITDVPLR